MEFCYGFLLWNFAMEFCYGILLWNFAMKIYGCLLWNFAMKIYGCLLWKFAMVACYGNLLQTAVRFWPYGARLAVPVPTFETSLLLQLTHMISY